MLTPQEIEDGIKLIEDSNREKRRMFEELRLTGKWSGKPLHIIEDDKQNTHSNLTISTAGAEALTDDNSWRNLPTLYGMKVIEDKYYKKYMSSQDEDAQLYPSKEKFDAYKVGYAVNKCECGEVVTLKKCVVIEEGNSMVDSIIDIYSGDTARFESYYFGICKCGNVFYRVPIK